MHETKISVHLMKSSHNHILRYAKPAPQISWSAGLVCRCVRVRALFASCVRAGTRAD